MARSPRTYLISIDANLGRFCEETWTDDGIVYTRLTSGSETREYEFASEADRERAIDDAKNAAIYAFDACKVEK